MPSKKTSIYVVITPKKVHTFANEDRVHKVMYRAKRMGVQFEYTNTDLKRGDPYTNAQLPAPY